jgi:hypothetical protein
MGCGAAGEEVYQRDELRTDVVAREIKRWEHLSIRVRLVPHGQERTEGRFARWRLAGIYDEYYTVCE